MKPAEEKGLSLPRCSGELSQLSCAEYRVDEGRQGTQGFQLADVQIIWVGQAEAPALGQSLRTSQMVF